MNKILPLISIILLLLFVGCTAPEEHNTDYSVEIEGQEMKQMTITQVANLWGINETKLLEAIKNDFNLVGNYNPNNTLNDIREEYPFSPAMIKKIAEDIKQEKR